MEAGPEYSMHVSEASRHSPGRGGSSRNDAKVIICKSMNLLGIFLPGVVAGMIRKLYASP